MERPAFELNLAPDGGVASLRLRGFEVLAASAHPTSSGAAPWKFELESDRVRIQPASLEPARPMVWSFRFEPDVEVILRGHDLMPMAADRPREIRNSTSVRFGWPGHGAISALWDRPRLPEAALTLRPAARALELALSGGESHGTRPTAWWVEIRDGSGAPSIEIVDHNPDWPAMFAAESPHIRDALGGLVAAIEHGGSTAVPGLAAKPVIDVWLTLKGPLQPEQVEAMAALGYRHLGEAGLAGQDLFIRRSAPAVHLHGYQVGDPDYHRHLDFRDWLRAHPDGAAAYARLKKDLANRFKSDRLAYTEAKSDFIEAALR
jgi:GrpB-like predicted nucleotidyltransferase (UPF0157 family)